jgi:hypothetical protein
MEAMVALVSGGYKNSLFRALFSIQTLAKLDNAKQRRLILGGQTLVLMLNERLCNHYILM